MKDVRDRRSDDDRDNVINGDDRKGMVLPGQE